MKQGAYNPPPPQKLQLQIDRLLASLSSYSPSSTTAAQSPVPDLPPPLTDPPPPLTNLPPPRPSACCARPSSRLSSRTWSCWTGMRACCPPRASCRRTCRTCPGRRGGRTTQARRHAQAGEAPGGPQAPPPHACQGEPGGQGRRGAGEGEGQAQYERPGPRGILACA